MSECSTGLRQDGPDVLLATSQYRGAGFVVGEEPSQSTPGFPWDESWRRTSPHQLYLSTKTHKKPVKPMKIKSSLHGAKGGEFVDVPWRRSVGSHSCEGTVPSEATLGSRHVQDQLIRWPAGASGPWPWSSSERDGDLTANKRICRWSRAHMGEMCQVCTNRRRRTHLPPPSPVDWWQRPDNLLIIKISPFSHQDWRFGFTYWDQSRTQRRHQRPDHFCLTPSRPLSHEGPWAVVLRST